MVEQPAAHMRGDRGKAARGGGVGVGTRSFLLGQRAGAAEGESGGREVA